MSDMPGQEPEPGGYGSGSAGQGAGPDWAGDDQTQVPSPPADAPPVSPGPAFQPPGLAPEPPAWSPAAGGQWPGQPGPGQPPGSGQWPGQPGPGPGQWPGAQAPGAGQWPGQPSPSGQWPASDATAQAPFGYYPQPPPRPRRTGLIIGLIAAGLAVLVAAAVAIGLAVGTGSTSSLAGNGTHHSTTPPTAPTSSSPAVVPGTHTLTLPHRVDGYTRETGSTVGGLVGALRRQMRSQIGSSGSLYARALERAKIGVYTNPSTPTEPLIFIGFSSADNPSIAPVLQNPTIVIDGFFIGAGVSSSKPEPPGPLGGTLRCGAHAGSTGPNALCAWADSSTLGMIVAPGKTPAQLATVMLSFRNLAEH